MSNLARSQADWTKLFRELGVHLAIDKELTDLERKFDSRRNRTQVRELYTAPAALTLWTFAGVKIGTNTDQDGKVFVRIADENPGAGQALVSIYKATGGGAGDKVCEGSAADGATVTLAEANSSGLSGTVKLPTVTASESDDKRHLQLYPDWAIRANVLFDGSEVEHGDTLRRFLQMLVQVRDTLRLARGTLKAQVDEFVLGRLASFQKSGQESPISAETEEDEGEITVAYVGILEDTRKNMKDEATGGEQKVLKNVLSAGTGTFDSQNQGQGAMAAPALKEWAEKGTITFVCTDETVGAEKFSATQKLDATGEVRRALNELEVGRNFSDPVLGISQALLTRTLALTVGSSNDFGSAANYTITGETPRNTEDGVLYTKIVKGTIDTSKWKTKFYKSSSRTDAVQVGESNEAAAGATGVGINPKNGSGLGGTCPIGSAPTENNTGTLSLQTFKRENTNGVPDKFTVNVTETSRGEFQDRIGKLWGYALNSHATPTITDAMASAGAIAPYSVRDA